jgi:hypothetical protein
VVAYNTVLARGSGIVVTPKEGVPLLAQQVDANAVFAGVPGGQAQGSRNLLAAPEAAVSYLKRPYAPLGELDLRPKGRWAAAIPGDAMAATPLPDWERDFDGEPRAPRAVGAYVETAAHPGWTLQLERKPGTAPGKRGS